MKCKKAGFMLLLCALLLCSLVGCGKKSKKAEESKVVEDTETKQETSEEENKLSKEAEDIVAAIQATSQLSAFEMNSDIQLKLKGKYINLDTNIHADTEIVQGENPNDLQMSTISTSDMDDVTAYAYYKDGIYYTDDQNGKKKEEKSSEEVLKMVTDITAMVTDAAEQIDDITVTQDGTNQIYTYTVPSYIAENYLKQLAESAAAEETPLSGAKANVEELHMISTVDADGYLIRQEATMSGTIKKAIFKIPAEAAISADFAKSNKTKLDIPTW